ncbi:MAG: response regulator transcription factor [Luteibacter sp.]|jgi:two-component system capsular synthesis response regulator RcsB|uniref:response regulator transcription factor n=1 Tax=Rhodanobacteraceae TaxID=1775411 RepID=UPI00068ACF9C|nr:MULTISPECIES: response regulator transcription factor [Rhodanobacteraceae]MDQ7995073.1 response regulator transcription factor [Luteibacter sp.]MDQ8047412.1 response regulator transcription factor [Luteibacter sp.]MDR6641077.1 two-component system capsular synthesis response regulator RcsB [Luteibacter sp. 1214]SDF47999.1 two component transcriptional regulator, LuxR family [Dyella sp. 333MFSha]SKB25806.1 two component transcriptional regulator, LuxR family [Luteibacter sp. 22Crub2.1]
MVHRVILADDHPVVLKGISLALTKDGLADVVGEAQSPDELLAALAAQPCDALITDFSMPEPGRDGLALLTEVRKLYPALPIMVITTLANPALYREILGTGVRGLIGKSGDTREIPEALAQIVSNHVYLGASVREMIVTPQGEPVGKGTLADLSPRELEILRLFAAGNSVTDIARATGRGLSTVSQQKTNAMRKLRLDTDAEIFEYIDRLRLPPADESDGKQDSRRRPRRT